MSNKGGSYIVDEDGKRVLQACTDVKVPSALEKDDSAKNQSAKSATDAANK